MSRTTDNPYEVRATSIGSGEFQVFIENTGSPTHYIRLVFGYSEARGAKRSAHVIREWIIVLDHPGAGVFIGQYGKGAMKNRRLWAMFEAVERQPKHRPGKPIAHYAALSPPVSKWRTAIGAITPFEIKEIDISTYAQLKSPQSLETGEIEKLSE